MPIRWLLVATLSVGSTVPSLAADRHVDPGGVDSGDCLDAGTPCRTISYGLGRTEAGDRLLVAAGDYRTSAGESFPLAIPVGVRLIGVDGREATILRDDAAVGANQTVRITFDGLLVTMEETGIAGFTIDGGGDPNRRFGLWIESFIEEPQPDGPTPWVRDCRITGFASAGVALVSWGFSVSGGSVRMTAEVDRNEIARCATGVRVQTIAQDRVTESLDRSLIRNNVIVDCGVGIELSADLGGDPTPSGTGRIESRLLHDTIVGSTGDAITLGAPDALAGRQAIAAEVVNNIVAHSLGVGLRELDPESDPELLGANDFHDNAAGGYWDADTGSTFTSAPELNAIADIGNAWLNVDVDPMVDRLSGRLLLASPVRAEADRVWSPPIDVDGQPRPIGADPDIGADEVVPLLRAVFTDLRPVTPAKVDAFSALADYVVAGPAPFVDPEAGVVGDGSRPLVVWALPAAIAGPILLVREPSTDSVAIAY